MTTVRFDAPEYVTAWYATRTYPQIHSKIAQFTREHIDPRDGVLLDLCSSTGLLARRLADYGYQMTAVQEPGTAADLGKSAGVYDDIPLLQLRVAPHTLHDLLAFVERHQVRTVVARRCWPELWDALDTEFPVLIRELRAAGVAAVVLEGRIGAARSTHQLRDVNAEAAALAPWFRVEDRRGQLAVLLRATDKEVDRAAGLPRAGTLR